MEQPQKPQIMCCGAAAASSSGGIQNKEITDFIIIITFILSPVDV